MRARAPFAAALLGFAASGCGLLVGVDWDKVAVHTGPGGFLPDGAPAPPGYDGGLGVGEDGAVTDPCPAPNVSCLDGCCPGNPDLGIPAHIAAGQQNTCVVTSTGHVRCWGSNGHGQLGRGDGPFLMSSNKPLTVLRIPRDAKAVSVGGSHVCAIVGDALACWGSNQTGELGVGSSSPSNVPLKIALGGPVTSVSAGRSFTCAVAGGAASCWGTNTAFQLGEETDQSTTVPHAIAKLASGVGVIGASQEHACAGGAGNVFCWGTNQGNCLGSSVQMTGTPQPVNGTSAASAIALGNMHSCAIMGGRAACWGDNIFGELGVDSVQITSISPVTPPELSSGVTSICAGFAHTCAVVNGGVLCMGKNDKGELGDGSGVQNRRVPVAPVGLTAGVKEVACGMFHTCALLDGGGVKCWGLNDQGQLGSSNNDASTKPVDVTWP